ncbi:MAG: fluoride efflux transporter CrcB [Coriobacteriia bacterium]|nr:fluoride efflux transporter CrcB [Coriobacteriia bacterium]
MREVAAVAVGGAIGATLRWGIGTWMVGRTGAGFPWHTMLINVVGAFLIGVLMALSVERGVVSGDWRLFLGTGVLGGFTTFSTLSYESIALMQSGLWSAGFVNMFGSAILGLGAAWIGIVVGRAV